MRPAHRRWAAILLLVALCLPSISDAQERGALFSSEELQAANAVVRGCKYGDCPSTKKEVVAALLVRCIYSLSEHKSFDSKDLAALKALSPGLYTELLGGVKDATLRSKISQQTLPKPPVWVYHFSATQQLKAYESSLAQLEKAEALSVEQVKKLQKKLSQPEMQRLNAVKVSELLAKAEQLLSRAEAAEGAQEQPTTQHSVALKETPAPPPVEPVIAVIPKGPPRTTPVVFTPPKPTVVIPKKIMIKDGEVVAPAPRRSEALQSPLAEDGLSLRAPAILAGASLLCGGGALSLYARSQSSGLTNNAREYTRIGLESAAMLSLFSAGVALGVSYRKANAASAKKIEPSR